MPARPANSQSDQISEMVTKYAPSGDTKSAPISPDGVITKPSDVTPLDQDRGSKNSPTHNTPHPALNVRQEDQNPSPAKEEGQNPAPTQDSALVVQMMQQMQAMQKQMLDMQAQARREQEEDQKLEAINPLAPGSFIQDEEMASIFTEDNKIDIAKLKGLLETVGNRAYVRSRQDQLTMLPELIETTANRQAVQATIITSFWDRNQDLSAFRQEVGNVADRIASENRSLPLGTVLEQAAKEVRDRLSAFAKAQGLEKARTGASANFAGGGSGGQGGHQPAQQGELDQQAQITEMLKAFA